MATKEKKDKIIIFHEIELDLEDHVIKGLCVYALREIKNDTQALVNYAANKILEEVVATDGKCLKGLKKVKKSVKPRAKSKSGKK